MKTIAAKISHFALQREFDFDSFMRRRGWNVLLSFVAYMILMSMIVYKTFYPQS